jgi:hypothetical protein
VELELMELVLDIQEVLEEVLVVIMVEDGIILELELQIKDMLEQMEITLKIHLQKEEEVVELEQQEIVLMVELE